MAGVKIEHYRASAQINLVHNIWAKPPVLILYSVVNDGETNLLLSGRKT
jgi:hypothetical protein